MASDLLEERAKRDFDSENNEVFIKTISPDYYIPAKEYKEFIMSDPVLRPTHKYYDMTREEMWIEQMKKARRAYELRKDKYFVNMPTDKVMWSNFILGQNMTVMHQSMFMMALENMCSDEQLAKWHHKARSMHMTGCYAQTEIGHGSNVAGLETTATFDKETDEFIIHTPTLTATKWWPGDMGQFSSHAVVFASLVIDGDAYGVMPFLVQLRSTDDFMPLKGVQLGDMGPKMGYTGKNNSWCQFDHVRIPRENLLARYTRVNREGEFSIEGDIRNVYSVMSLIRAFFVAWSAQTLMRGCLIATRYSAVRRQFKNTDGQKAETKLIDYQTQQQKLFPLIAQGFSFFMAFGFVLKIYFQLRENIKKEDYTLMDEMHHLTSGMKSVFT